MSSSSSVSHSSKTSSHLSKACVGQGYQTKVYFHANVDSNDEPYEVDDSELREHLAPLIGNENITWIAVYKKPLAEWQLSATIAYHAFIVFQTGDDLWWSIEKNDEGVTLQRSKKRAYVVEMYRRERRAQPVEMITSDVAVCPLEMFADLLYFTDAVGSSYNLFLSNCKDFASKVFNLVAHTKKWWPLWIRDVPVHGLNKGVVLEVERVKSNSPPP